MLEIGTSLRVRPCNNVVICHSLWPKCYVQSLIIAMFFLLDFIEGVELLPDAVGLVAAISP